jgi:hypothetical protein
MNIDYNQRFSYSSFKNPEPYPKFQQSFLVKNNWSLKRTTELPNTGTDIVSTQQE